VTRRRPPIEVNASFVSAFASLNRTTGIALAMTLSAISSVNSGANAAVFLEHDCSLGTTRRGHALPVRR